MGKNRKCSRSDRWILWLAYGQRMGKIYWKWRMWASYDTNACSIGEWAPFNVDQPLLFFSHLLTSWVKCLDTSAYQTFVYKRHMSGYDWKCLLSGKGSATSCLQGCNHWPVHLYMVCNFVVVGRPANTFMIEPPPWNFEGGIFSLIDSEVIAAAHVAVHLVICCFISLTLS